jgi:hypothetical protein
MKRIVLFEKEKETKNTIVFTEKPPQGTPPIISTLYVQKWFVGDQDKMTLTVEFGEPSERDLKI